jgi:23S rRNA (cytosine1962-C5)-methyltransferase
MSNMVLSYPVVILKSGREFPILAGHPWVFSNGVETVEGAAGSARGTEAEPQGTEAGRAAEAPRTGSLVEVLSAGGAFLGIGTYHPGNTIRVRMLSRSVEKIDPAFFTRRFARLKIEKSDHLPADTDGFRLVHADADGLPGLVVDLYGKTAVFQIHTAGMEPFREAVIAALRDPEGAIGAEAVVERSDVEARRQEGLRPLEPVVHAGTVDGPVPFRECGLTMLADVLGGQKTGFFLDQRDARTAVRRLAGGRRIVNLFSYSCAFGLAAAAGGAESVTNVDVSGPALHLGGRMFRENGFTPGAGPYLFTEADVFDYLEAEKENIRGDIGPGLLVCDPPAFAKSAGRLEQAKKAYSRLNRLCFESLGPGAVLVTSSCSGMLTADDFLGILRVAAGRAGRSARILASITQPFDHTVLLPFPEGRYLKTFILEILGPNI